MIKSIFIALICLVSAVSEAQFILNSYIVNTPVEVRINMSKTAVSVSTYNNLFGDPKTGVRTVANLNDINGSATGWSISTIGTTNWRDTAYNFSAVDGITGITAMSFFNGSTAGVYNNAFYNYGALSPALYDAAFPQFLISNLNPAKTYEIKISGMRGTYTFDCAVMRYSVEGATSPAAQNVNGNVTSQSNGATFYVQPNGSNQIKIFTNTDPAQGTNKLNFTQAIWIKQL